MPYFMGIDIGSGKSKGVILEECKLISSCSLPSGINYESTANQLLNELLVKSGLSKNNIRFIIATGCGSANVKYSNRSISEIRCCVRGIFELFPEVKTIIDVEGQTTTIIRLGTNGRIANFIGSEKCASSSGRFLDIIANVLQIPLDNIGILSLKSKNPVIFTTSCAVFGESEAVSRVAEGIPAEDILAGVHKALAEKISTMIERVGLEKEYAICGGGGLNIGLIKTVETLSNIKLIVPVQPDIVTALGAAILAKESASGIN